MKLAANVMWRSGVPLAVQVARGTTGSDSKEVVEPIVEVVEEIEWMVVLPEIGDVGTDGEADRTDVLSVDWHPGGAGKTDGTSCQRLRTMAARMIGWVRCRRSGTQVA